MNFLPRLVNVFIFILFDKSSIYLYEQYLRDIIARFVIFDKGISLLLVTLEIESINYYEANRYFLFAIQSR